MGKKSEKDNFYRLKKERTVTIWSWLAKGGRQNDPKIPTLKDKVESIAIIQWVAELVWIYQLI